MTANKAAYLITLNSVTDDRIQLIADVSELAQVAMYPWRPLQEHEDVLLAFA
ncbi:hypothetical protein SNOG_13422 [Parastagonospora nodorum SN15]|uniref:Uncharacterized protein n=1 Tax=Phaeosphaeria nodorum (strain SN15 / ATCC MYA-4574 / FGSC 10173) TaxID=321614 RepID=Q0U492_PHANO|nr:hypothetical protein SNOG_13422 [Parastagonospora nodorum SN15]EAT79306.1 hypothetical protein SNOG_13422 [Parastagonospora nodorum SN15]